VIHKTNGGLSDARNAGLDIATGKYIGFVDSDDFIHPQMYEVLLSLIIEARVDIIQCNIYRFSNEEVDVVSEKIFVSPSIGKCKILERKDFINNFSPENKFIINGSVCNKLYKRYIFNKIRFPAGQYFEDSHIKLNTLEICDKICIYDGALYYYRQNINSIMNSIYSPKWFEGNNSNCLKDCEFFFSKKLTKQYYYSLDDYVRLYIKDRLAVSLFYLEYKKVFVKITKDFCYKLFDVMKNPLICRMKKITLLMSFIHPKTAYKLCRKYFPECLYDFMR